MEIHVVSDAQPEGDVLDAMRALATMLIRGRAVPLEILLLDANGEGGSLRFTPTFGQRDLPREEKLEALRSTLFAALLSTTADPKQVRSDIARFCYYCNHLDLMAREYGFLTLADNAHSYEFDFKMRGEFFRHNKFPSAEELGCPPYPPEDGFPDPKDYGLGDYLSTSSS